MAKDQHRASRGLITGELDDIGFGMPRLLADGPALLVVLILGTRARGLGVEAVVGGKVLLAISREQGRMDNSLCTNSSTPGMLTNDRHLLGIGFWQGSRLDDLRLNDLRVNGGRPPTPHSELQAKVIVPNPQDVLKLTGKFGI